MSDLRPERLHLLDEGSQQLAICGQPFVADVSGALYWPSQDALILADLDLCPTVPANETIPLPGSSPMDQKNKLILLAKTIDRYQPRTIVALGLPCGTANRGDQQTGAPSQPHEDILKILSLIQDDCEWIWVDGDNPNVRGDGLGQEPGAVSHEILGGMVLRELTVAGMTLRHKPLRHRADHEIAAHMRPAARISTYGHDMRRPCFIGNGQRLILPAFATSTGGRNVLDRAFDDLLGRDGMTALMLGQNGVYPICARRLAGNEPGQERGH